MLKNVYLGLVLHFYQPWWQPKEILRNIINECYGPIFMEIIPKMPGFCFTGNINYSLLELLENERKFADSEYRAGEIIDAMKQAVGEKKIELLGSTAYHPIMPLIPDELQRFHLTLDTELKGAYWQIKHNCDCAGVFLPEMAFSQKIISNLKQAGYQWTVLEDVPFCVQNGYALFNHIVSVDEFRLYFRSNYWSNRISGGKFDFDTLCAKMNYEIPGWTKDQPAYIILAMDAETFGHHHKHLIKTVLEPMLKHWGKDEINILRPIEQIGQDFPTLKFTSISDGSWAASEDDCCQNNFFPLWNSPYNCHHQDFWRLINMALKYFGKTCVGISEFLKITSSCHTWWISGRPWWNPEFMKPAARIAMKIIARHGAENEIAEATKIFERLISLK